MDQLFGPVQQNGPVTSRGQLALRQRINMVLEKFTQETLKEPDKKVEEFFEAITIHITTHLFSSLKKCLQQGNYDVACEILKYLVENRQCSKQFIWKMMTTIMNKDYTFFVPMLSETSNSLVNTKGIHHDEIHLVNTIHLLNKEVYDKAYQEATKFDGKGLSTDDMAKTAIATSALLAGYKTILEYLLVQPGDNDSLTNMKHSFELLIEKNSYLPMFAEPYTFVLIQLGLQKEAEEFIYKYVESGGVIVVEHAIDIVKLHMPKASQRLMFCLLEMIAVRSSSHPKVLDLCRQHLCIHNSRTRNHSDTESNFDFDSDEDTDVVDNHASLNKCLELIINFMDPYVDQLPTPLIREGWKIMSDSMRRICHQGEDDCFHTIVKLWHNDRKRWWTCFHDQPPSVLLSGDAELYYNMGIVCYVLESETHPFVVNLLKLRESSLLKSLINQLRRPKINFDSRVQSIIRASNPTRHEPVSKSVQDSIFPSAASPETPCSSRFEALDSEKIPLEFQKFVASTRRVRDRDEYKTSANIRSSTAETIQLPICEMLAKRYERRRHIRPRSSSRCSNSSAASSISLGSLGSLTDFDTFLTEDESEDEGEEEKVTNDPFEMPPDHPYLVQMEEEPSAMWSGRLRPRDNTRDGDDAASTSGLSDSNLAVLKGPSLNVIEKKKLRWKQFLVKGKWEMLEEDGSDVENFEELSSSEQYFPTNSMLHSDTDDESLTASEASTMSKTSTIADELFTIGPNDPASIPSSYASISPASSISSGYTPKMDFANSLPQPREVIPNPQCFPYPDLDVFSACSSQTEDIASSITQAISRLDGDVADNALDLIQPQTRTGASLVELTLPEERTLVSSFVRHNFGPPSGIDPESEEYVLEAEIDLPEETLISNRSFSRDFENSSPDMFLSLSENESSSEDKSKDALNRTENTQTIKPRVDGKTVHEKEPDQQKGEFDRLSTVSAPPIAVSSPVKKRKKKQKVYSEGTEASQTTELKDNEETIDDHQPCQRKGEFDSLPTVSAPPIAVSPPTKKKKKRTIVDSEDTEESQTANLKIDEATIHDKKRDQLESGFNSLSTVFATPAKKRKKKQKVGSEGKKPCLIDAQIETCKLSTSNVSIRTLSDKKKAKKKHTRRSSELQGWNVEVVKTVPRKAHTRERDPDYWSEPEDESVVDSAAKSSFKTTPELKTKKLKLTSVKKNLIDSLEDEPIASTSKVPKISVKCTPKLKEKTKKPIPKRVETPCENSSDPEAESIVDLVVKSSVKTTSQLKDKKLNVISEKKNLIDSHEDEPIASTSKTPKISVKCTPKLKEKRKKSIPQPVETPRVSNSPDATSDTEEEIRRLIEELKPKPIPKPVEAPREYSSDPEDESVVDFAAQSSFKTTSQPKNKRLNITSGKKNLIDSHEDEPIASTSKTPKISVKCTPKLKEKTKKPIPKRVETPCEYSSDPEDESGVNLAAKSSFKNTSQLKNKRLNKTSGIKNPIDLLEDEPIASTSKTPKASVKSTPKLKKKTKKSIPKPVETSRVSNSLDDSLDVEEEMRRLIEETKLSIKKTQTSPANSPKKRKRLLTESKITPCPGPSSSDSEKESLIQELLNTVSFKKKSKTKKKSKRSSTSSQIVDATFDFRNSIASVISNFLGSDSSDEDDNSMSLKKKKS